jgi:hypothetical protein
MAAYAVAAIHIGVVGSIGAKILTALSQIFQNFLARNVKHRTDQAGAACGWPFLRDTCQAVKTRSACQV